jgi:sulfate permease, SulP family
MVDIALATSFAALIFAGPLSTYVSFGIGYAMVGFIAGGAIIALYASWSGTVGGSQSAPAAIIALMAASIVSAMPEAATAEAGFITVVVAIAITTLATGLFFVAVGYFRLGGLVRFLPYPVIGGFLAGTGWLLITGAISLMAGAPADLFHLPSLLAADTAVHWLPGVLLAVVIWVVTYRYDHYLILPVMLLASTTLFFLTAWAAGISLAELSAGGWLLGPFASDGLWQPITPAALSLVYWPAVGKQGMGIIAAVLVTTVGLLLNTGGLEMAVDSDLDYDKELRVSGAANVLTALGGGLPAYPQISFSVLNHKIGANHRLTGMIIATVCLLALAAGASLLAFFPKVIVGALLLTLGLSFIIEWVIEGWSKLPRVDFVIVVTILLVTAVVGFLQAVALGLLLAIVLFVVGYSQVDVVRHEVSRATSQSRVSRSREEEKLLRRFGEEIYIVQLQGFIFFGTADILLDRIRRRLYDGASPRPLAVILDFGHVPGIDTTAMISFGKLKSYSDERHAALLICGANDRVRVQLERGGLSMEDALTFYFDSLDRGLAWGEERLLARVIADGLLVEESTTELLALFEKQMAQVLENDGAGQERKNKDEQSLIGDMAAYFRRVDLDPGTVFIRQGEAADRLYFLVAGRATARLNVPDGDPIRLETMGSGRVIGELGFYLGGERTAEVVTNEASTLFVLTSDDLARMTAEAPRASSLLQRLIVNLLAERVLHLTESVRALDR